MWELRLVNLFMLVAEEDPRNLEKVEDPRNLENQEKAENLGYIVDKFNIKNCVIFYII
jgi:hypothetical protein